MPVSDDYLEYLHDLLAWVPGLRAKRMFGGAGLYGEELFFAIVADDELYLKADDESRPLYRGGGSEPFLFVTKKGKESTMDYWLVPAEILEEPEALRVWVQAALDSAVRSRK